MVDSAMGTDNIRWYIDRKNHQMNSKQSGNKIGRLRDAGKGRGVSSDLKRKRTVIRCPFKPCVERASEADVEIREKAVFEVTLAVCIELQSLTQLFLHDPLPAVFPFFTSHSVSNPFDASNTNTGFLFLVLYVAIYYQLLPPT